MAIEVRHIEKKYGQFAVYHDFSLTFPENKVTAVLGPSGCGKTTLLNLLAGLATVDRGEVATVGEISYLFQEPRLLPWLTLRENVELVLADKMDPEKQRDRARYFLEATGLASYRDFYPGQVSGGMKQRAAIARAFAYPSRLLLMDEPFKSLDLKTRSQLVGLFLKLFRSEPRTVVTITHDVPEAVWLGDRVVVLSEKPARIVEQLEIEVIQEERMGNESVSETERRLYRLMLGAGDQF